MPVLSVDENDLKAETPMSAQRMSRGYPIRIEVPAGTVVSPEWMAVASYVKVADDWLKVAGEEMSRG